MSAASRNKKSGNKSVAISAAPASAATSAQAATTSSAAAGAEDAASQQQQTLWSRILQEAKDAQSARKKYGDVLVLAPEDRPEIAAELVDQLADFAPADKLDATSVVNYAFLEWKDLSGSSAVWICANKGRKEVLLAQLRRKKMTMEKTCAIVCLNMEEPWTLMEQVESQLALLEGLISRIAFEDSREDGLHSIEVFQEAAYQRYHPSPLGVPGSASASREASASEAEAQGGANKKAATSGGDGGDTTHKTPAPAGGQKDAAGAAGGSAKQSPAMELLKRNLGIPVVFVVCRADLAAGLAKEKSCLGWMDAVPLYLRKTILPCGGALFYHQVAKRKNTYALYDYLGYRLFGGRFDSPVDVTSVDEIFVPTGYDDEERLLKDATDTVAAGFSKVFSMIVDRRTLAAIGILPTSVSWSGVSKGTAPGAGAAGDAPAVVRAEAANSFLARAMREMHASGKDGSTQLEATSYGAALIPGAGGAGTTTSSSSSSAFNMPPASSGGGGGPSSAAARGAAAPGSAAALRTNSRDSRADFFRNLADKPVGGGGDHAATTSSAGAPRGRTTNGNVGVPGRAASREGKETVKEKLERLKAAKAGRASSRQEGGGTGS